jgi:outer membrane beta-barrel protein
MDKAPQAGNRMTRSAFGFFATLALPLAISGSAAAAAKVQDPAPPAAEPAPAEPAKAEPAAEPAGEAAARPGEQPGAARRPSYEDIVVVPRKAFLKSGRLELAPFTGVSLNDVLIHHYTIGGDLNFYLTDVFSIGLQGQYFVKERSGRESLVGLQYNRVPSLNKYKYAAAFNFGYVPGYGKFTLFNKYIWHWDIFVSAGVGAIWTEIIPRIAGEQTFQNINIMPDVGAGTRFFLSDWLTVSFSLRDYIFNDKFEPTDRMRGEPIENVKARAGQYTQLVNNIMFFASVGFYLPTSFQYRTPR